MDGSEPGGAALRAALAKDWIDWNFIQDWHDMIMAKSLAHTASSTRVYCTLRYYTLESRSTLRDSLSSVVRGSTALGILLIVHYYE